jgi:hypothetical protein
MLDETLYGIAERTDSGVATAYSTLDGAALALQDKAQAHEPEEVIGSRANPYAEYPIHVQVIRGLPARAPAPAWSPARVKAALRQTTCNPQVRFVLKTAVAVAAVIVLAVLFHGTTGTTSGITLAQVFKAFGKAGNVHITRFDPEGNKIFEGLWISRTLNRILLVKGQERILYDLEARKEYVRPTPGASGDAKPLSERQYAGARLAMNTCLGFTLSDVPADATWTRARAALEGFETYQLAYAERNRSKVVSFWRWDITIDPATMLPKQVEMFRRDTSADEWHCAWRMGCQYLTDAESRAAFDR